MNNDRNIKIALIQQANNSDIENNKSRLAEKIKTASEEGAQLIVLQELHNGLYFCQVEDTMNFDQAETIPGPSTEFYGQLAEDLNIVLVTSIFEKRASGIYHNTAVVYDKNKAIKGMYRKMHIPDDPAYYEKFYFTPGDTGFNAIDTSIGRLGVLVCWDQWYPEAARLMALDGAEILIYPTAIGWESTDSDSEKKRQFDAWQTIQRSHGVANGLYVVSVNRVGFEPDPSKQTKGIQFWGNSFVAGPQGDLINSASEDREEILYVDVNLNRAEKVRRIWPFFRDRRIDAYHEIVKRYRL